MLKDISICPYSDKHLDAVLQLNGRSASTSRTVETWRGNDMTAVLAFYQGVLIGAIPLEPRNLAVGSDQFIKVLWVSGAHVDANYRSLGIGSEIDRKIGELFSDKADAVFVYRGEPKSGAFRWYQRNDYSVLSLIISLEIAVDSNKTASLPYDLASDVSEFRALGPQLELAFRNKYGSDGGYVVRLPGYWENRASFHVYKEHYNYFVLSIESSSGGIAYVFLGETRIGDNVHRLDIFEFIATNEDRNALLAVLKHFAKTREIPALRLRLSVENFDIEWFFSQGFVVNHHFYLMAKFFNKEINLYSFQGMDDICQAKVNLELKKPGDQGSLVEHLKRIDDIEISPYEFTSAFIGQDKANRLGCQPLVNVQPERQSNSNLYLKPGTIESSEIDTSCYFHCDYV